MRNRHPLDKDRADKVRLWLDHLTMGTGGPAMLNITLDAEDALREWREDFEREPRR